LAAADVGGVFACTALARVGAGQVFRGAVPPPADYFDAYIRVDLADGLALFLPPGAPAVPWRVTVA